MCRRRIDPSPTRQGRVDGAVENVATAKHVKFVLAANAIADERVKKVAELLGLLECCEVIRRLISHMSQYINSVGTAHVVDTTQRPKNEEEVQVERTNSSGGRADESARRPVCTEPTIGRM